MNEQCETVPLQQLLREIAARTASEQDADAIRLAADMLDERDHVDGEIVEMDYSEELGIYCGAIRCPKCGREVHVRPLSDSPVCACGLEWDFDVHASGTKR